MRFRRVLPGMNAATATPNDTTAGRPQATAEWRIR